MTNPTSVRVNSAAKSINRRWMAAILFAVLLIAGGATAFIFWRSRSAQFQAEQTTEARLAQITTVTALGRLEPAGEIIKLSAPTSSQESRISKLLVEEGDRVAPGQIMAILSSRDRLQKALRQAEEEVRLAQAQLAQTLAGAQQGEIEAQRATITRLQAERQGQIDEQQAAMSRLETELQNAELEYQRYELLYQEGATSASERDGERLTRDTARKHLQEAQAKLDRTLSTNSQELKEAKATLERIAEVRPVDVEVAKAEAAREIAARDQARATLEEAYVRTPQAGMVLKIYTRAGEVVNSETGIADIGQTDQMYAIAEVYQSDISKVQVGQRARVTSESLPDIKLLGTIETIGSQVERQDVINADPSDNIDSRIIEVKIRLDKRASRRVTKLTNLQVKVVIEQ